MAIMHSLKGLVEIDLESMLIFVMPIFNVVQNQSEVGIYVDRRFHVSRWWILEIGKVYF
jgi:hypothetical protein